ncbi:Kinesin-like protein kif17 [Gaertneriomyces sp. JEL0708]|nr:Kinesin-like protein kif17 [Gaertneriomyces sp. JEL0708]
MEGPRLGPDGEPPFDPANKDTGIILRVANQIMQHIGRMGKEKPELEYFVRVSYLEIYNEGLRDLLVAENEQGDLRIRQDPESANGQDLVVSGITERSIETIHDYIKILQTGSRNRKVGETNMNEKSSRSHAVMTIILEERVKPSGDMSPEEADMLAKHGRKRSKIHLIDLAGSERANATGATGDRLREGAQINLSLSSLGNVINALTTGAKHVPYRDSKLTYLLSDSLGGNSLTLMITCVTPTLSNYDETLSTLRFAERVKKVRNVAKVNVDPTMMRILALEAEVRELKELLAKCTCGAVQQARAKMVSVGAGSGDWNAGADAWTMSDSAPLTDKATNTAKKRPWWKRLFACCSGKSEPRADRKTQLMRKIFPAEKMRSAPMTDDDERGEGLMKSIMGKLTFS